MTTENLSGDEELEEAIERITGEDLRADSENTLTARELIPPEEETDSPQSEDSNTERKRHNPEETERKRNDPEERPQSIETVPLNKTDVEEHPLQYNPRNVDNFDVDPSVFEWDFTDLDDQINHVIPEGFLYISSPDQEIDTTRRALYEGRAGWMQISWEEDSLVVEYEPDPNLNFNRSFPEISGEEIPFEAQILSANRKPEASYEIKAQKAGSFRQILENLQTVDSLLAEFSTQQYENAIPDSETGERSYESSIPTAREMVNPQKLGNSVPSEKESWGLYGKSGLEEPSE